MANEGPPAAEEWPTSADAYELQVVIGSGAFARVWKAVCTANGANVAIKIMDLDSVSSSFDEIRQEVQTMRLTDHPNVLKCYASFVHERSLWLVMQLMDKGSCLHVMNLAKRKGLGEGLREDWLAAVLKATLSGLEYFHASGQIHRDIKAGNILLDGQGNVRIADFGVAGWLIDGADRRNNRRTFCGSPCWMAPEVMEQTAGYDSKADIWSFGITALELAKGFAPYAHFQPMKVLLLTLQNDPPSLASYDNPRRDGVAFSDKFTNMVAACLKRDPAQRPTAAQLLGHKFFKKAPGTDALVGELLSRLEDITDAQPLVADADELPGAGPLFVREADAAELAAREAAGGAAAEESKYVPGTTWVFDDDSGVSSRSQRQGLDVEDFGDAFEAAVGSGGSEE